MTRTNQRWWLLLAATTLAGFALRLWSALDESIFLDEVSLRWLVHDRTFGSMIEQVKATENSPVLGFLTTWAASKIGSSPQWIRLPSIAAGTLLIPTTAVLARRVLNATTGSLAGLLCAFAPLLVFFSVEARPYAFAALLTTLAILAAVEASGGKKHQNRWWALFAVACAGAALSHYTSIFALIAISSWVLIFRPSARLQLVACIAGSAAIFCIAWIGPFASQLGHSDQQVQFTRFIAPLSLETLSRMAATLFAGRPIVSLSNVPGPILGLLVAACTGLALAGGGRWLARKPKGTRWHGVVHALGSPAGALALVVLIQPIGLIASGIAQDGSFLLARNAIYALPPLLILLSWGILQLPRGLNVPTAVILVGSLATASVVGVAEFPRPDSRAASKLIAERWEPGDIVLEQTFSSNPQNNGDITAYASKRIADSFRFAPMARSKEASNVIDRAFADGLAGSHSVFVTAADTVPGGSPTPPPARLAGRFHEAFRKRLGGTGHITIVEWQPVK